MTRKARHLEICTDTSRFEVEGGETHLDKVHFVHDALAEIAFDEIDTSVEFLGRRARFPVLISCMTGGSDEGFRVNRDLARAAARACVPVGMGSIRILFEHPELLKHFHLRPLAPGATILANLGVVQVRDRDHRELLALLERLEVDALVVHLNPGQELFQVDGDRDFRGTLEPLARLCATSRLPILVKETGFGLAPALIRELAAIGVAYVDIAGSGGTNWIAVEAYRADAGTAAESAEFRSWGIPTGLLLSSLGSDPELLGRVLASGGIRTGMDVAKCLALGARLAGLALPMARAVASGGAEAAHALLEGIERTLRRVMLLTGSRNLGDLRRGKVWLDPWLVEAARGLASFGGAGAAGGPASL